MLRRVLIFLCLLAVAAPFASPVARSQSDALVQSLAALRSLSGSDFSMVRMWASSPSQPGSTFMSWQAAEAQILALEKSDRDAVLSWLRGNGRGALYARGATDAMIGGSRWPIDTGYVPATPPPTVDWRAVPFISGTMSGPSPGGIAIRAGWAAVKKDATSEVHCISFTNTSAKTAIEITFTYSFLDNANASLASLMSVRTGEFSPNVAIDGPATLAAYFDIKAGKQNPRSLLDNCWSFTGGTGQLPLLRARYVTFAAASVKYSDGSVWP